MPGHEVAELVEDAVVGQVVLGVVGRPPGRRAARPRRSAGCRPGCPSRSAPLDGAVQVADHDGEVAEPLAGQPRRRASSSAARDASRRTTGAARGPRPGSRSGTSPGTRPGGRRRRRRAWRARDDQFGVAVEVADDGVAWASATRSWATPPAYGPCRDPRAVAPAGAATTTRAPHWLMVTVSPTLPSVAVWWSARWLVGSTYKQAFSPCAPVPQTRTRSRPVSVLTVAFVRVPVSPSVRSPNADANVTPPASAAYGRLRAVRGSSARPAGARPRRSSS